MQQQKELNQASDQMVDAIVLEYGERIASMYGGMVDENVVRELCLKVAIKLMASVKQNAIEIDQSIRDCLNRRRL